MTKSESHPPAGAPAGAPADSSPEADAQAVTGEQPAAADTANCPPATGSPYAVIAESAFAARGAERRDLVQRILDDPRMHDHKEGFQSCIQCGICTSGCPAARFTEFTPREVARRALEGDESLLTDDSLWYCYYCYTCQSRCPRHNSVAVINQVIRGLQVESGHGRRHVQMFAEWCATFYEKGMGGDPHLLFPAIGDAWGEKWRRYMDGLLEFRAELGLGPLFPDDHVIAEVRTIMEQTGFVDRLEQVSGKRIRIGTPGEADGTPPSEGHGLS